MDNFYNKNIYQIQKMMKEISPTLQQIQQSYALQMQRTLKQINPIIQQITGEYTQQIQRTLKQIDFPSITQAVASSVQVNMSPIQSQIQDIVKSLPPMYYQNLKTSALQISPSMSNIIDTFRNGDWSEIKEEEMYFLNDLEINNQEASHSIENINTSQSKFSKWQLFFQIFIILLTPFFAPYSEDLSEWQTEVYENIFQLNLTGEINASIRKDTYLRKGRSKHAPIVLKKTLKQAQPIILHNRKGNWVKVSVYLDDNTYTGWVEKSKILK